MISSGYLRTRNDGVNLMQTISTLNKKLKQIETGEIYKSGVIDVIVGYNGDVPYGIYTYEETDEDIPEGKPGEMPEI